MSPARSGWSWPTRRSCPDDGGDGRQPVDAATVPAIRAARRGSRSCSIAPPRRWGVDSRRRRRPRRQAVDRADGRSTRLRRARRRRVGNAAACERGDADGRRRSRRSTRGRSSARRSTRPNGRDIVTGAHHYPSDITPAGHALRQGPPPAVATGRSSTRSTSTPRRRSTASSSRDGDFVGVAAPTTYLAEQALDAHRRDGPWEEPPAAPVERSLYDYLRERRPRRRCRRTRSPTSVDEAAKSLRADVPRRLRPARPDGAAGGGRRVGRRRQADGLDRRRRTRSRVRGELAAGVRRARRRRSA